MLEPYPVARHAGALAARPPGQPGVPTLADIGFEPTNLHEMRLPSGPAGAAELLDDFLQRIDDRCPAPRRRELAELIRQALDASLGMIGLEQNLVMKIFSLVAVVLMPPSLIAGVYGMNFEYMPELRSVYGYPIALAAMLASAIIPYWLARRKGWL